MRNKQYLIIVFCLFTFLFLSSKSKAFAVPCDDSICKEDPNYLDSYCESASSVCPETGEDAWIFKITYTCKGKQITCNPDHEVCYYVRFYTYYRVLTECGAGDRCPPCAGSGGTEAVCAGICNDGTGVCETGGWYKTCCQVSGAIIGGGRLTGVKGTCTGDGGCSGTNVTTVRWEGFGSPGPACSNTLCLRPGSWDGYSWIVDACGSTPAATLPPGVTPTVEPTLVPPQTFCGGCNSSWVCDWPGTDQRDCSAGPCERLYSGYGPDPCPVSGAHPGQGSCCTWCFSKGWGDDCGSASPAVPSLSSPAPEASVNVANAEFKWYKYQTGELGKCGGCSASYDQSFCWGFRCAAGGYGIPISQRKFELFVSRRPLNLGQAQGKNPSDWLGPRVTVDAITIPNNPELRVKGEGGYVAPDLISRTINLEVTEPGTYWWFVRAKNPDGTKDSVLRSFNYCAAVPPGAATCTSPNNESINDTSTALVWNAPGSWGNGCPTTKSYQVLLNEHFPPTSLACSSSTPANNPATTCNYSGLDYGKLYYWRVKTINNPSNPSGFSYSNTCYFMVREPGPWWQTTDGDVHAQGTIASLIPACATTAKYLSLNGVGDSPGVVTWGGGKAPTLEKGAISTTKWQANDLNRRPQVGFDYLANRLNLDKTQEFSGTTLPASDGIYYTKRSSFDLQGGEVGTNKIIIFAEGDVRITGITMTVDKDKGGFFALIAKGRITFDGAVTQAEGFYLADGVIDTSLAKSAFKGSGSFVAWGGFVFQRDLSNGTTGGCTPSETFFSRPDLYINAPKEFLITPSFFQELAP